MGECAHVTDLCMRTLADTVINWQIPNLEIQKENYKRDLCMYK